MSIRIVTDSTCDLPSQIIQELGIEVIPLYINFEKESFLDGVEISREEFYSRLPFESKPPTTSIPGTETIRHLYEKLAKEGAKEILSLHISKSLSATVDVARAAAREIRQIPVTVLDSDQLSLGLGFLAEKAAKLASKGGKMNDILTELKDQISRTYVFAALDTLEYLKRSGRMNGVVAGLGELLQIKPILKMHAGNPTVDRARTKEGAKKRLISLVEKLGPLEKISLVHTNAREEALKLFSKAGKFFRENEEPLSVNVTPVLGTNIGPGAVGFTCIQAAKS